MLRLCINSKPVRLHLYTQEYNSTPLEMKNRSEMILAKIKSCRKPAKGESQLVNITERNKQTQAQTEGENEEQMLKKVAACWDEDGTLAMLLCGLLE